MTMTGSGPFGEGGAQSDVTVSMSGGLMTRLARLDIALAFTSYRSGFLFMLGSSADHGAQLHRSVVSGPRGLAVRPGELVLAAADMVIRYADVLRPQQRANGVFDACYAPRTQYLIGDLDARDVGVDADGRIVFVNTRYNCLATSSHRDSFEPVWRPPFVTALGRSDTIDGWRARRSDGGVAIDVRSGEIVAHGLSMPHSPRVHDGRLWLLNSGTGEFGTVGGDGRFAPRASCPGFTRGLALHGRLAFVGVSKPRSGRFEGPGPGASDLEPWCGIQVIDIDTGDCVDWFRIAGAVAELDDIAVVAGRRCPMALSPGSPEAAHLVTVAEAVPDGIIAPVRLADLAATRA